MFETEKTIPATLWFMDGLIYGLSGTMDWDLVNKCQGSFERAIQDFFAATELIKQGKAVFGFSALFEAWTETEYVLVGDQCTKDLMQQITEGQFAHGNLFKKLVSHPKSFAENATKFKDTIEANMESQSDEILRLIEKMNSDLEGHHSYAAGKDLASIINLGIENYDAQTEDPQLVNLGQLPEGTLKYFGEMVAAFFAELVYLNRLEGLTHCALDTHHIAKDVKAIVHDI